MYVCHKIMWQEGYTWSASSRNALSFVRPSFLAPLTLAPLTSFVKGNVISINYSHSSSNRPLVCHSWPKWFLIFNLRPSVTALPVIQHKTRMSPSSSTPNILTPSARLLSWPWEVFPLQVSLIYCILLTFQLIHFVVENLPVVSSAPVVPSILLST